MQSFELKGDIFVVLLFAPKRGRFQETVIQINTITPQGNNDTNEPKCYEVKGGYRWSVHVCVHVCARKRDRSVEENATWHAARAL